MGNELSALSHYQVLAIIDHYPLFIKVKPLSALSHYQKLIMAQRRRLVSHFSLDIFVKINTFDMSKIIFQSIITFNKVKEQSLCNSNKHAERVFTFIKNVFDIPSNKPLVTFRSKSCVAKSHNFCWFLFDRWLSSSSPRRSVHKMAMTRNIGVTTATAPIGNLSNFALFVS